MSDKNKQTSSDKDLRESTAKYRALFKMASDAIFLMRQEQLVECNPKMLEMFRCELEQFIGQTPKTFSASIQADGQDSSDKARQLIRLAYTGKPQFFEWLCQRYDASEFTAEVSLNRIDIEGNEPLLMGIVRDITERKLNEKELQKYRNHLEELVTQRTNEVNRQASIIENVYEIVIATDLQSIITEWNDGAERTYGYTADEAIGQSVALIYPPDDLEVLEQQVIAPLVEHGTHETEIYALRKNGDIFPLHLLLSMVHDETGQPVGMIAYSKDISDRKQIEEALKNSEQRLKLALKASKAGAWSWDIVTNEAFWSEENYQLMGLEPGNGRVSNDMWLQCIHPDDRERASKQVEEAIHKRTNFNIEYRVLWPGDQIVWINSIGNLVFNLAGEAISMHGIQVDITKRMEVEQELTQAKEQAEEANQAKSAFLSRMSHEFRTPLNAILGFAQILDINENKSLGPHEKKSVEQILKGGWHLLDVVKDLLDLSAIEANKIELQMETVDLLERLQDSLDIMQPLAQQREITLHGTAACADIFVHADPVRLKQVLLNLLSNAVKYNHKGGSVTLSCEIVDTATVRISVADTGSGISEADIAILFEPFSRLYLSTHALEGTGIGLTIAKQLVELMGGRIGVTSKLGHGSTFWIELPLSQSPAQAVPVGITPPVASPEAVASETTLLYIEDSPSHIELVETITKSMTGIRLLSAHTPMLGLELAQAHRPDLIVCDICLPGMDGFEVLEQLRASEVTREIPVIAVSANAMPMDIEKGLRAGFRRYLTKPINVTEFKKALDELVRDNGTFLKPDS